MKKSIKRLPKRTQEELTVLLDLVRKKHRELSDGYPVRKLCKGKLCFMG